MNNVLRSIFKLLIWVILILGSVALWGIYPWTRPIFAVVLAAIFAITIYYKFPNYLVRMFPHRYTKVDPNHAKLVQRGSDVVRVLVGTNYFMVGNDLDDPRSFEVKLRTNENRDEPAGGGECGPFVTALEAWISPVTGYRVVGATFADFFGATIVKYDLNRPEELRHTMKGKDEDTTDHVILSPQIYPFNVDKAETGKLIKMKGIADQENNNDETRQRVPVDLSGQYTFQVANLWKILYGTNFGYFQFVISTLQAGIRDQVQKLGIDDMFSNKVKNNVGIGILALNDDRILKYDEVGIERGDIPLGKDGQPITERPEPGTINGYGFRFVQVLIEDVDPDQGYLDDLAKQQKAILDQQANISRTELDITVAENQLAAAEIRARATAAPHRERLAAIATGGKALEDLLRHKEHIRDVLVADRYGDAVENAEHGTIFVNAAGAGGPVPMFNVTPPASPTSPKPTEGTGQEQSGERQRQRGRGGRQGSGSPAPAGSKA